MVNLKVNEAAVQQAKKLISEDKIALEGSWKPAEPTAETSSQYIAQHGWEEYGRWFLAINTDKKKDEKQHYEFPYGDFKRIYREGLIAVKQRAAQYKHQDIEKAADDLLQQIEKKHAVKHR